MDIPSIGSATSPGLITPDKSTVATTAPASSAATSASTNATPSQAPIAATTPEAKKNTDPAQLDKAVNDINKSLQDRGQDVRFSIDQSSKRVVVKIVEQGTNKVLRQIPTEQALEISQSLDKLQGLIIKQEA